MCDPTIINSQSENLNPQAYYLLNTGIANFKSNLLP